MPCSLIDAVQRHLEQQLSTGPYRDWCKNIAAALYVLACELDRDPSAITKAIEGDAPWKQRQAPAA